MSDGDATRKTRWARSRSARQELGEDGSEQAASSVTGPPAAPRRGSPPPPLLFQVDTLDPWSGSHPGHEPHSAPRHEIDAAFERALGPSFDPTAVSLRGIRGRRRVQHAGDMPVPAEPLVSGPNIADAPVVEAPVVEPP